MSLDPAWEVSATRTRDLMNDASSAVVLIDCRTVEEHRTARIAGSLLIPLQEIETRLAELEAQEGKTIIIHCHHGVRSLRAAAFLRSRGIEGVFSLAGGIDAWSLEVDPSVPRY